VSAAEAATALDPSSSAAWSTYAHALARTDRVQECIGACERALALGDDREVEDLLARVRASLRTSCRSAPRLSALGSSGRSGPDRLVHRIQYAQQLHHAADQEPLLLDLYPGPSGGRKDHVIAGADRHPHADVIPQSRPGPTASTMPCCGGGSSVPGGTTSAGATDTIRIELLDDHPVEQGTQLLAHGCDANERPRLRSVLRPAGRKIQPTVEKFNPQMHRGK